jgi:hypothetical protein
MNKWKIWMIRLELTLQRVEKRQWAKTNDGQGMALELLIFWGGFLLDDAFMMYE